MFGQLRPEWLELELEPEWLGVAPRVVVVDEVFPLEPELVVAALAIATPPAASRPAYGQSGHGLCNTVAHSLTSFPIACERQVKGPHLWGS
jgi:hypothetical protein